MKIFLLILMLAFSLSAFAQRKRPAPKTAPKPKIKTVAEIPVAPSPEPEKVKEREKFTLPLAPDDPKEVGEFYRTVKDRLEKSEFETKVEFEKRLYKEVSEIKYKDKRLASTLFILNTNLTYDAETQEFSGRFATPEEIPYKNPFRLNLRSVRDGAYSYFDEIIKFKLAPDQARRVKPNLKVALYGFPVSYRDVISSWLDFVPLSFKVFDITTGEIYFTRTIEFPSKK